MDAARAKRSTRRIRYLTQDQLKRFFEAARDRSVRDQLALHFCYRFALRASECCGLRTSAVDVKAKRIQVQGLKEGESLSYRIPLDLLKLMRRHQPGDVWYFESREGDGRLSRTRLWQVMNATLKAAALPTGGDEGFNLHSLRHSAAVSVLDSGRSIEDAADLLRHKSVISTAHYAKVSERRRGDYLRALEASDAVVKVPASKRHVKARLGLVGKGEA